MQPLLPKIKTGDILHGTRNLRRWLTDSCKIVQLTDPGTSIPASFVTRKEDSYTVICNRSPLFAVWSPQNQVTLIFTTMKKVPNLNYLPALGMTPSTFPFWFIRTPGRNTNLDGWSPHAELLWRGLHLRSIPLPSTLVVNLHHGGLETPFTLHQNTNEGSREKFRVLSRHGLAGKRGKETKVAILEVPWQPKRTDLHQFRYTLLSLSEKLEYQKPGEPKGSPFPGKFKIPPFMLVGKKENIV